MTSQAIIRDVCVASGPLPDSLTSWSGDVASQPWSRAPSGDRPPACRPFRSIYSSGHGWCPQEEARPAVRAGDPGLGLAPSPSHRSLLGRAVRALSGKELETALRKRFPRAEGFWKAVSVY